MNKCVGCGDVVTWNPKSHICSQCIENKAEMIIIDEDRVVESPEKSWF